MHVPDGYLREVLVECELLDLLVWLERNLDYLCLTVGIGREVCNTALWSTHSSIILTVTCHGCHVESLDV